MLAIVLAPPLGFVGWILIGGIAGAIAGRIVRGRGYGCLVDVIVGVIGAFLGGYLVSLILPSLGFPADQAFGFIGTLIVAVLGAVVLLGVLRLLFGRR